MNTYQDRVDSIPAKRILKIIHRIQKLESSTPAELLIEARKHYPNYAEGYNRMVMRTDILTAEFSDPEMEAYRQIAFQLTIVGVQ